ncbi:hypothetical protein PM082_014047 [Marasmius tenuissimus]|nr:hypothetical protein PM082_014047 [Marasmius tenuissimus]
MSSDPPFSPEQLHNLANQQKQVFIFITVLHILAILSTIFRLARRIRIKRLSWDDAWAVVATFFSVAFVIMGWVTWNLASAKLRNGSMVNKLELGTTEVFVAALTFAAIWSSRISLSLSIVRILPVGRLRTVALAFSIGCFFVGSTILTYHAVMLYSLRSETNWPAWKRWKVAGPQVTADILCSIFLVTLPLYALSKMTSLPSSERRIILILFASTLLSLGVGCGEVAAMVIANQIGLVYGANVQAAVGLMVCNCLVIVTALLRLVSRRRALNSRRGAEGTELHTTQLSERDEQEYNSGEDPISLGGTRNTSQHRATTTRLSESQLTEFGAETQTCSYILGTLSERSEGPVLGSESAVSHASYHERTKRGS